MKDKSYSKCMNLSSLERESLKTQILRYKRRLNSHLPLLRVKFYCLLVRSMPHGETSTQELMLTKSSSKLMRTSLWSAHSESSHYTSPMTLKMQLRDGLFHNWPRDKMISSNSYKRSSKTFGTILISQLSSGMVSPLTLVYLSQWSSKETQFRPLSSMSLIQALIIQSLKSNWNPLSHHSATKTLSKRIFNWLLMRT